MHLSAKRIQDLKASAGIISNKAIEFALCALWEVKTQASNVVEEMGDSDFSRNSSTDSGIDEFYESTERIVSSCLEMGPAVTPTSMQQTRLTISERSVVFLVKKHLEENPEVFDIMCEELSLSSTDFYSRLQEVWGGIFTDDRINWGRILTMLCFCRAVSAYSRKIDIPPSAVESIVPWATCFISQTLKDWIVAEGGWVS